jgi:hypothetical protein
MLKAVTAKFTAITRGFTAIPAMLKAIPVNLTATAVRSCRISATMVECSQLFEKE